MLYTTHKKNRVNVLYILFYFFDKVDEDITMINKKNNIIFYLLDSVFSRTLIFFKFVSLTRFCFFYIHTERICFFFSTLDFDFYTNCIIELTFKTN